MKRSLIIVGVALVACLAFAGVAGATTAQPSAPAIDVFAYTTGIFDAISSNLTVLLTAAGLFAGVGWVMRRVRMGSR